MDPPRERKHSGGLPQISSSLRNRRLRPAQTSTPIVTPGSLLFDSSTLACNAPTYTVPDTGPGTIETWLFPTATKGWIVGTHIVPQYSGQSSSWWYGYLYTLANFNNKSIYYFTANPLTLNQWSHLAFTWDDALATLWINGTDHSHGTPSNYNTQPTTGFTVGGPDRDGSIKLEGSITQVRTSNIVRYTTNFTPATSFTPDANTTGLWRMLEASGTTVADDSGNGHTLNFPPTNPPTWSTDTP